MEKQHAAKNRAENSTQDSTTDKEHTATNTTNNAMKRAIGERTFITPDKKKANTTKSPVKCNTSLKTPEKVVNASKLHQSFPPEHKLKKIFRDSKVMQIASNVKYSKYTAAFNKILSRGPAAERAFNKIVSQCVARQIKAYSKAEEIKFPQIDGLESLESLDLDDIIDDVEEHMPTLHSALRGALMPKKYHPKQEKRRR